MASSTLFMCFFICLLLKFSPAHSSAACANQNITGYAHCDDLPTLNATLYYTYNKPKSSLSVVFIAAPPKPDGWVAWGINLNPTGMSMKGAEVIAAFKKDNVMFIQTYYLKSYLDVRRQKLSFDVSNLKAKQNDDGFISIYATLKVPDRHTLNHTWQVGTKVEDGMIIQHDLSEANRNSKGNITLADAGFCDSSVSNDMAHATHSLMGFGVLLPIGLIIPRYLDLFLSDPESLTWFYVYGCCQLFGFGFGFGGWVEGIKIGWESGFSAHGIIGTVLVFLGAIQIIILFKNTNKMKHKDRLFRSIHYYTVGYMIIFLGTINNAMGIKIKNSEQSWESYYQYWLIVLGGIMVCEIFIRASGCCFGKIGSAIGIIFQKIN